MLSTPLPPLARGRSTDAAGSPDAGGDNHRRVLAVTCIALATVVSAVASLNVAIPSIARDTHASQTQLSWIVDAYSLVFAALLLPAGALGDRFGRRRALIAGLAIFGAGSLAAMCRADANWLIAMRGLLGVGAALVMPATLSTITSTFPAAQRAKAVGTWAGVAGGSAILGLLTSGLVLEEWSWRAVFALNVVLAAGAIVGTMRFVPESADGHAPPLDWVGALLAAMGLGVFTYAIIEAPSAGWASVQTLGGLAFGLALVATFLKWESRASHPLIDPRLFKHRAFAAGTLSITLQFFAFFGFIFLLLQYLQLVIDDSPLVAALSLIPMVFGMMPAARGIAPRLVRRLGTGRTCTVGLVVAASALVWLSTLDASSSYWTLLIGLVPLGAGMGLAMTPATSAVTDALPADKQGVGSAMNDLARELGGALGIAVLGSILQSVYRNHLQLPGVSSDSAEQARSSLAEAAGLGPQVWESAQAAFVDGMQYALLGGAAAIAVAAAAVAYLHHRSSAHGVSALTEGG
jgi:EmrB/QacA subfamily drug resistance transporter